jgi:hypothetical protein
MLIIRPAIGQSNHVIDFGLRARGTTGRAISSPFVGLAFERVPSWPEQRSIVKTTVSGIISIVARLGPMFWTR